MERNFTTDALILSSRIYGEDNRMLTILSPEKGIFDAVLYGGRKSKLRSMASPFHTGAMWLYNDETRHSVKITDFDVQKFRPSLREDLYKSCAASFCAELLIKTRAGNEDGQYDYLWTLANGFLDGLELSDRRSSELGLLRFIWRFLALQGIQPDPSACCICEEQLYNPEDAAGSGKKRENMLSSVSYFDEQKHGFICSECASGDFWNLQAHSFSQEALNYLNAINTLSPREVRQIRLHPESVHQMHDFLIYLAERCTGCRLQTLEAGKGIL